MRFERVRAISFGPLQDSTLEFKRGFNLIYGPNEAGKSSWHAAIYAGLCGMRRGRGRPLGDDEEFGARHRPWDGSKWRVGVDVLLADGRKIELLHELDSHVYSVVDQLGRSCMSEIIHEGAPDGSKWLGLDRRSFLATACIRQMELLEVTSSSELLQEDLQRAAATAGTQETAAGAIALIDDFLSEKLGSDRANSRKRLRAAIDCVESSGRALDEANSQHGEYLHQLARADEAAARAEQAARHLALIEAHVRPGRCVGASGRRRRGAVQAIPNAALRPLGGRAPDQRSLCCARAVGHAPGTPGTVGTGCRGHPADARRSARDACGGRDAGCRRDDGARRGQACLRTLE